MIRKLSLIIIGSAALVACQQETIVANGPADPMAEELAKAAPVELPPAIASSKTYRCKDNGVVTIDWLQDNKGAYLHGEGYAQTHLKPPEVAEGQPAGSGFAAEGGYALKGEAKASSISLTLPGKGTQACHV